MDDGSDGVCAISINDSSHHFIEMDVLMVFSLVPCSLDHKFADIVDRRVGWISRPFTNVVEGVSFGHESNLSSHEERIPPFTAGVNPTILP